MLWCFCERDGAVKIRGQAKIPIESLFPQGNELVLHLLDEMLCFEPRRRMSARAALGHAYFAPFDPLAQPEPPIHPDFNFNFERQELSRQRLRQMVLDEVQAFRRGA